VQAVQAIDELKAALDKEEGLELTLIWRLQRKPGTPS
jgi:hypothetical protein